MKETLKELLMIDCFLMFEILLLFFDQTARVIMEKHNNELYKLIEIDNKIKTQL